MIKIIFKKTVDTKIVCFEHKTQLTILGSSVASTVSFQFPTIQKLTLPICYIIIIIII